MPELPEAETVARGLDAKLRGRVLGTVSLSRPDVVYGDPGPLCALLRGRKVRKVTRRGKRVVTTLSNGCRLIFHLGMSGQVTVSAADAPIETHTHLRIEIGDGTEELRYRDPRRFGGVWCLNGTQAEHVGRPLTMLGVEPLEMSFAEFAKLLKRSKQIKALLMDQTLISGLGNIYCDEALYRARIHPQRIARGLNKDQARRLYHAIRQVLRSAIRAKGSSVRDYRDAGGEAGAFQRSHQVYGRAGKACKRCRAKIIRMTAAGRSTHICPRCQRGPRPPKRCDR